MAGKNDTRLQVAVIVGSTRDGRFGPVVADWLLGHTAQREDMNVDLIDLAQTPLPTVFPAFGRRHPRAARRSVAEAGGG